MNGRYIDDEMNRFEAEIHQQNNFVGQQQPNSFMGHPSRMFIPPQMRGMHPGMPHPMQQRHPGMNLLNHPNNGMMNNGFPPPPPSGMIPLNRFQQRPMGQMQGQSFISAEPRPSITISAPAQTTTSKASDAADDDDILATLQKYEAEVKKETTKKTHKPGLMPTQVKRPAQVTQTTVTVKKLVPAVKTPMPVKTPTVLSSTPQASTSAAFGGVESGQKAPPSATIGEESLKKAKKQKRIVRVGGGQIWEDETLKEWDPNDFRLFCGDLGNDVTDEVLVRTFSRYPSFVRAKVVRDKKSNKTKGFGFVSFRDPSDFTRAMKELNGKYVGSRPIKLRKSNWKDRNIEVVRTKQKIKQQMGYKW